MSTQEEIRKNSQIYPYEKPNINLIKQNLEYEHEDLKRSLLISPNNDIHELKSDEISTRSLINDTEEPMTATEFLKKSLIDIPNKDHRSCLGRWFHTISGGSLRGSIFAVASVTFGGGCLAFPAAISKVGPVLGFLIFILSAWLSYLTTIYLVDTGIRRKILDYNELVRQSASDKMRIFADINNIVLCLGVIMSYQYMVYGFLMELLKKYFEIEGSEINRFYCVLICMIFIQIPLSLLKNISILQYASLTATVSLCYCIIIIVVEAPFYFNQNYNTDDVYKLTLFPPQGIGYNWLNCLSTFLFGFCVHNGLFQVFMEMDRPNLRRSLKVINRATWIEIILYFSISFGGFFSFFYNCEPVILLRPDLNGFDDYFMTIAKIALMVVLNCCMAINYNIMRLSFRSMVFNNSIPKFWIDLLITISVYIISNIITFYVKDASTILGFVGGISTVVISFVCPILIRIKLGFYADKSWKIYANYLFLAFMCIIGIACTAKAVYDYIDQLNLPVEG